MLIKKKIISAGLLGLAMGALSCSAQAAGASASAWASVDNFSYTLVDLAPADGIAPSIIFDHEAIWAVSGGIYPPHFGTYDRNESFGTTSQADSNGSASTLTTGTAISGTSTVLLAQPLAPRFVSYTDHRRNFILSAHTEVTFYATGHVGTLVDDSVDGEGHASANAYLYGDVQFTRDSFRDYVTAVDDHQPGSRLLTGTLRAQMLATSGSIFMRTETEALRDPIRAIPEPSTYAMLLAGLGLMGFVARRKGANAR